MKANTSPDEDIKNMLPDDHPIFDACRNDNAEVVEAFLNQGISIYAKGYNSLSLPSMAANCGAKNVLAVLIKHGLDLKRKYGISEVPFTFIVWRASKLDKKTELIAYLLDAGVGLEDQDDSGCTVLSLAAAGGDLPLAKLLVNRGANILTKSRRGETLFYHAARGSHVDVMEYFYGLGASIEDRFCDGRTPLLLAAQGGDIDIVRWLLAYGADINARCNNGKTAIDLARQYGHTDVVNLLSEHAKCCSDKPS